MDNLPSGQPRPEILTPDYADPKEVYAFFGLAAYCAQLVEQGIINLLVGLRVQGKTHPTWSDVQSIYEQADRMVLGRLLRATSELLPFDPKLGTELQKALEQRNYLVHHFFIEHAEDFFSAAGRRSMIDELREIIAGFKCVDPQVDELWHAVWSKYGFTEERIERELDAMKRLLQVEEGSP